MPMETMRICQVVASINQEVGGPAHSVTNLAVALSRQQIVSHLFTLDYQRHGEQIPSPEVKLHSYPAPLLTRCLRGLHPESSRALQQLAATELDLIHNHGLWMFPNLYARQAAVRNHRPLIISPRGMLEAWSLRNSWFKKLPAWRLYEFENLKRATAFHATSTQEVTSIRQLNFRQPIALIPNGVDLPDLQQQPERDVLIQQFPELANKYWLLFLSRIHPKKGLDNLLHVWQNLADQFPDWHLLIAGPDHIGYQRQLEQLSASLSLEQQVTFTGMLSGPSKACALGNADLFVLPTHSENFGIAIAEALSHQVPVITTHEAPWSDLESYHCGWWIADHREALREALMEAMQLSVQERRVMGARGRTLIAKEYSWDRVASEMVQVYHWLLGSGETPSCVRLDLT